MGDVLTRTETVNPELNPNEYFDYIDVSSVSNKTFQIEETQRLMGKNAPSRARRYVRENDIIFATIRPTLRRIAIVPSTLDKQVCSTGYFVMRPGKQVDHRFLFHWLFTDRFMGQMEALQKGASYPAVTDAEVRSQEICFPSIPEQQRIAAILDEAFEGIATAKANAEKSLQNARELFESERESLLTNKGSGWRSAPLSDLCNIKHGFAFQGEFFKPDGEYVLLTPGNFFESGGYRDRGEKQKFYIGEIPNGYILSKGDLLVAMTEQAAGLLGSPLLVPVSNRFLHNQRLGLVTGNPGVPWCNEFFFHVFNTKGFREAVHASGSGVKVRHTSPSKIGDVIVSYPTDVTAQMEIAIAIQTLQDECDKLASTYSQKLDALEELKQSLLHRAFNGDL